MLNKMAQQWRGGAQAGAAKWSILQSGGILPGHADAIKEGMSRVALSRDEGAALSRSLEVG